MAVDQKKSRQQGTTSRSSTTGKSYQAPGFVSTKKDKKKLVLALNKDKPLLPYQVEGIQWLWELHNRSKGAGGIFGDDMGLGKTYQLCIFIISLFQANLIKKVLVVTPSTLMDQWSQEFLGSGLQPSVFYGAEKQRFLERIEEGGVAITTYDTLRCNVQSLRSQKWDYLVIDEGHLIKNWKTERNNSLMDVTSNYRVLLTGTVIQNDIDELWPLLNFCCPRVFDDLKHFRDCYCKPIYCGTNKNSTVPQEHGYFEASELLRKAIRPYFLRRTKEEVLNLPKKHEVAVWLKLTESQRFLYQTFVEDTEVRSAISAENAAFQAITIQKKLCNHPVLVNKGKGSGQLSSKITSILEEYLLNNDDIQSCKLLFLDILLDDLCKNGHYVLIFCQMKDMLTKIQELLTASIYKFLRIDGDCPLKDRYIKVNEFQEGAAQILLLTTQVGAVGLTLTKADRVIIVDPSWNYSTDEQSVCRAYRFGQKNDILVYRLLTCGTAEDTIYKNQIYKQMLSKIVTEERHPFVYFTEQERKEIFHIKKDAFEKCVTQQKLDKEHECHCEMNRYLEKHLSFLKRSNLVAGIGHHNHLFSQPALPTKEETRPTHAMTPKELKVEKKKVQSLSRASVKNVAEPESDRGLPAVKKKEFIAEKKAQKPSRAVVKKVAASDQLQKPEAKRGLHAEPSWFKTPNAIPQPLQEVETFIQSMRSNGSSHKELCLQVPSEMVRFLIGKEGVTIRKLKADSGARHIEFFKEGDQLNVQTARIIGSAEQVLTASSLIKEKIQKLAADQRKHNLPFSDTGQGSSK